MLAIVWYPAENNFIGILKFAIGVFISLLVFKEDPMTD